MINLRDQILKSQIAYYNGLIAKHQQNVEIYLNQPVGIGEHSDVMGTIDGEINSIAQAHEKIEIINPGPFYGARAAGVPENLCHFVCFC